MSSENPTAPGLRVLLVEDNVANQKVAVRFLERLGHQSDLAQNGREALAALEKRSYDVVLMDLQMPEMDGLEATRRIRVQWPQGGLRIVALTANATPEDRAACAAVGMDGLVSKPIDIANLKAAIEVRGNEPVGASPPPAPADTAHDAPFDPEHLRKLGELGDPSLVPELVAMYMSEATSRLALLRDAVRQGNADQVQFTTHSLRGSSAALGLSAVVVACQTLEDEAKQGMLEQGLERTDALEVEIARAREWLAPYALP